MPSIAPPDPAAPLELPRLVMRIALLAATAALALAVLLGVWRMAGDIDEEVESAAALAGLMSRLADRQPGNDRDALLALAEAQSTHPLRHLELRVTGQGGRLLLGPSPPRTLHWPMSWLVPLHQRLLPPEQAGRHSWLLMRPDGSSWTVTLATSRESERIEAIETLLGEIVLMIGCIGLMLLVMHWKVRQSFWPLASMLAAIDGLERRDLDSVARLPRMPMRELEAVAAALRHLAAALGDTESERRLLGRKMMTLQEDERVRLARELHDEMGQQLTALRVDAAWLAGSLTQDAGLQTVAQGMADRCGEVQLGLRGLLARLRPLDHMAISGATPTLASLHEMLNGLVLDWSRTGAQATDYTLRLNQRIGTAPTTPLDPAQAALVPLSADLVQSVFRIGQEGLTNVARHARARKAILELTLAWPERDAGRVDAPAHLICTMCDDGIGVPDPEDALRRGNGLGGIQERVWACAGELSWQAEVDKKTWHGLCLRVQLPFTPASLEADAVLKAVH